MGEARRHFFWTNQLTGDGGYDDRWVKLKVGPLIIPLPNIEARKAAVPYHDAHHILLGTDITWTGEVEVAAWEIASGCRGFWEAWLINFYAFTIGLFVAPRQLYRAYLRGRLCTNLYSRPFDEALLAENVGELRKKLGLDRPIRRPSWLDRMVFAAFMLAALMVSTATVLVLAAAIRAAFFWFS